MEEFRRISISDLRRGIGGRKAYNAADSCTVHVAGRTVKVNLKKMPTNLAGDAHQNIPLCPTCHRLARVLRVVPFGAGLGCQRCLRERLSAAYASQLTSARGMLPMPVRVIVGSPSAARRGQEPAAQEP